MIKLLLLTLFLLLLTAASAQATNRWAVASGGASSGTCPIGTPCTLTYGLGLTVAGDTLNLRAGTYTTRIDSNTLTINNGTSYSNAVTIYSYDGKGAAIIQPNTNASALNFYATPAVQYIIIDGLTFDCTSVTGSGQSCVGIGSAHLGAHHIRFTNTEFRNTGASGPSTDEKGAGVLTGGDDLEFLNCSSHHNGVGKTNQGGNNAPYGFYITGARTLIQNCDIYNNGAYGVHQHHAAADQGTSNNIYEQNRIYDNGAVQAQQFMALLIDGGSGSIARNNIVWDTTGNPNVFGISLGSDFVPCTNCFAYYNTIIGFAHNGLKVGAPSTGAVLRNNIVHNSGSANLLDDGSGSTWSNNLCTTTCAYGTNNKAEVATSTFVSLSTQNFTLKGTSLAVGAATPITGIAIDGINTSRPQGTLPDIGALELVSGTLPTIAIAGPTSAATYATGVATITVTGTSNLTTGGITYTCDRCTTTSGSGFGALASWILPTLTLKAGINIVTVTATDGSGNAGADTVTVTYTPTFPGNSLVAAYAFEEGSGTSAADSSGNANTGTLINTPTWLGASGGRYGNGLTFDGITQYISIADSNSLDLTQGFTISMWAQPTASNTDYRSLLAKDSSVSGIPYRLFASVSGQCGSGGVEGFARVNGISGPDIGVCDPTPLQTTGWTHLAVTYDGSLLRLYKQGTLIQSQPQSGIMEPSTGILRIASSQFDELFQGKIDEVRVYNYAIPATGGANTVFGNNCNRPDQVATPSVIGDANCPITAPTPPTAFKVSSAAAGLKIQGTFKLGNQ